ncbi:glycosyltransferase family 4 protein [Psychroserpens sp. NJDZ02]|uniref:glycosyltransferase family 4 protein n=1 Tax=Psychroserpens sp. NJDZ02 TaxID=2570561 RepID=UPI0010A7BBB7|nr:glycosyltransferase family 4 protein [Psychroserpens sp. NJDZ02]QCE42723.1 glycosyltransferase family 4 protein [Psychroserpens sp. NJDZ02]
MDKKKVLIITYYWPPAGGPGVQRWLKFVKYLPDFNIEPIVYCPSNANYPIVDKTLLDQVNPDLIVLKQPIREPYKLAQLFSKKSNTISKGIIAERQKQSLIERLMLFVRGNFFIPDARKNWVKPSVKYLATYIQDFKIDTIITSGPPHSLHLIGMALQAQLGVKWIADFRDPWTTIGYHKQLKLTAKSKKKHKDLERKVLNNADQIIVTSPSTKVEFEQITKQRIQVITNGYDNEKVTVTALDKKFTLSHIGSLLSKRNPEVLWKVLHDLVEEDAEFASQFQLNLIGAVGVEVLQSIQIYNLTDSLNNMGYVSHSEAVVFQKKSQLLLLIEIDSEDTKAIIPGKLFEYMVADRPIIAIGPRGADVASIIKTTNTGQFFDYQDYDNLKNVIKQHFEAFKVNNLKSYPIGLQQYSRQQLTKNLAGLINPS